MWGGTDSNPKYKLRKKMIQKISYYYDIINIAISEKIFNTLVKFSIEPILVELNMVDSNIFKPIEKLGKSIYVYNGFTKGNEYIYGEQIYKNAISHLKNLKYDFEYIFSNELNCEWEQMPQIYSKCFIGIRLTEHDGNANTVMEFNSMKIPIIFNGHGGIKWSNYLDVANIIIQHYNILISKIN